VSDFWSPGLGRYVARHPLSAWPLSRAGWRLRRQSWWRRVPFLPLPPQSYWAFRLSTANGSTGSKASPFAMVDAAKWSLRQSVRR
jgi:hypothetical protein